MSACNKVGLRERAAGEREPGKWTENGVTAGIARVREADLQYSTVRTRLVLAGTTPLPLRSFAKKVFNLVL